MRPPPFAFEHDPLLLERPDLIIANKPAGVLVHNSDFAGPRERSLREELGERLGHRVFPLHRLDRGTSGVVLFARAREDVAPLQAALEQESTRKVYVALVRGRLHEAAEVDHPIKTETGALLDARSRVRPFLVSEVARCSLVEVELLTGRMHQARRHLKHLSHPVLGDSNYGDTRENRRYREAHGLSRLALHALRLEMSLPTGELLAVTAPIGHDLARVLRRLFAPSDLAGLLEAEDAEPPAPTNLGD